MFCFRFDIDTRICAKDGVPRLLDVLSRQRATASFYTVLGREEFYPGVWFQQRFMGKKTWFKPLDRPPRSKIKKTEFLRRLFWPIEFAREQRSNLMRVIDEGHELGVHSVRHEDWALNLPTMDVDAEFKEMTAVYDELFGAKPKSFAAPTFRTNRRVLEALDKYGFSTAGDLPGEEPFRPVVDGKKFRHVQVPVNVRCEDTVPLTEHYWKLGYGNIAIANLVNKKVDEKIRAGKPAVVYGHGILEGGVLLGATEKIIEHARKKGYEIVSCIELAKNYRNNYKKVSVPKK